MSDSILKTLKAEHRQFESILSKISDSSDVVRKKELYLELKDRLIPHMEGEERTIYAHLMEDVHDEDAEELAQNAEDEHQEMKELLAKLDNTGIENEEWNSTFEELKNCVLTHVSEEESELFAEAKEDFSNEELIEFNEEFTEAKQHISPY